MRSAVKQSTASSSSPISAGTSTRRNSSSSLTISNKAKEYPPNYFNPCAPCSSSQCQLREFCIFIGFAEMLGWILFAIIFGTKYSENLHHSSIFITTANPNPTPSSSFHNASTSTSISDPTNNTLIVQSRRSSEAYAGVCIFLIIVGTVGGFILVYGSMFKRKYICLVHTIMASLTIILNVICCGLKSHLFHVDPGRNSHVHLLVVHLVGALIYIYLALCSHALFLAYKKREPRRPKFNLFGDGGGLDRHKDLDDRFKKKVIKGPPPFSPRYNKPGTVSSHASVSSLEPMKKRSPTTVRFAELHEVSIGGRRLWEAVRKSQRKKLTLKDQLKLLLAQEEEENSKKNKKKVKEGTYVIDPAVINQQLSPSTSPSPSPSPTKTKLRAPLRKYQKKKLLPNDPTTTTTTGSKWHSMAGIIRKENRETANQSALSRVVAAAIQQNKQKTDSTTTTTTSIQTSSGPESSDGGQEEMRDGSVKGPKGRRKVPVPGFNKSDSSLGGKIDNNDDSNVKKSSESIVNEKGKRWVHLAKKSNIVMNAFKKNDTQGSSSTTTTRTDTNSVGGKVNKIEMNDERVKIKENNKVSELRAAKKAVVTWKKRTKASTDAKNGGQKPRQSSPVSPKKIQKPSN